MMWEYFNNGSYSWGHPVLWMTLQIMLVVAGIVLVILMVRNGRIGNTHRPRGRFSMSVMPRENLTRRPMNR